MFLLQLYEMGTEPERKQFLDDLFAFMQKKGNIQHTFIKNSYQLMK